MNTIRSYGSYEQTASKPLIRRVDVPATTSALAVKPKRGEQLSPAYKEDQGVDMVRCGDTAVPKGLIIDIWV